MHVHLIVSGRVQGVGFRYSSQQKATEYDLAGWVRNKSNGTVELEIEGPGQRVDAFINDLKAGLNPAIHVDHITKQESAEEKGFKRFSIK